MTLPPLPAGDHVLRVESGILVTCGQDSALTMTGAERFPFTVSEGCGESPRLGPAWPAPGLALARPQPNPFSREATLALSLSRESDVALTVHDLTGRLVATVQHGWLSAGPHTFTWRGTRDDGSAAVNGVYFVRAMVGGKVLSQKVALLREGCNPRAVLDASMSPLRLRTAPTHGVRQHRRAIVRHLEEPPAHLPALFATTALAHRQRDAPWLEAC